MKLIVAIAAFWMISGFVLAQAVNPVPFLSRPLAPDAYTPGGNEFALTVRGAGFMPGSVVQWNGQARQTTFISKSALRAKILPADVSHAGTATVTIETPAPGGGTSNPMFFSIHQATRSLLLDKTDISTKGVTPVYPLTADLNDDGILDLVVANKDSNTVAVFRGIGNGTFAQPALYSTGASPTGIVISDFNGDGVADLVTNNFNGPGVSVLLGTGDGTFQNQISYSTGLNPSSLLAADFNNDGKLDLAVSDQNCNNGVPPCGPGEVAILLGNGDGTFRSALYAASSPGVNEITAGDFNGDGNLDLAAAAGGGGEGSGISVLLGVGDGTFEHVAPDYPTGTNPSGINAADLNGDGILDLAAVNNAGSFAILLGNGQGGFEPLGKSSTEGPGPNFNFVVADLNADNAAELVIANSGGSTISVFRGNGDATFRGRTPFTVGRDPYGVVSGDFNSDGLPDLAAANGASGTLSILLQIP